jgi:cysteine desulfurase
MINLDNASFTAVSDEVLAEFNRVERELRGNALARHGLGEAARAELNRATEGIAALLGVLPTEIIFTSGASEANNLAIKGLTQAYSHVGKHILSTCLEHPSVSGSLNYLSSTGFEVELLKILPNGKIDLHFLRTAIRKDTVLLCVCASDSELGAVQPLAEIAEILADFPHCHMHVDAAMSMGKIPVPLVGSTMCFSPYKFHGLNGLGVLIKREKIVLEPLIHGGGTNIYRGGTPSPSLAAACFLALKNALSSREKNEKIVGELRQFVIENISAKMNSPADGNPYILNMSYANIKGADFQAAMNSRGIAISVKNACSADNTPSRPVFAVTGDKKTAMNSWRVSFAPKTSFEDLEKFLAAAKEISS